MANSKRRCRNCRHYAPPDEFFLPSAGLCSEACMFEYRQARTAKRRRTAARDPGPSAAQRDRIRRRDNRRCRLCGAADELRVHHILYRSQGGPHEDWNLITLCETCHSDRVHANKRRYQPLCRAYIWALYVEGRQPTLPELEREMARVA